MLTLYVKPGWRQVYDSSPDYLFGTGLDFVLNLNKVQWKADNKYNDKEGRMQVILGILCLCCALSVHAVTLPSFPSQQTASPHNVFLYTGQDNQSFDSWVIDGGYMYNIFRDVDLYVGARVNSSISGGENGFLSGISYQVTERVSVKSTLYSLNSNDGDERKSNDSLSAELSSSLRLSDNLDLRATLDYQQWQQGVEVGIGFRF